MASPEPTQNDMAESTLADKPQYGLSELPTDGDDCLLGELCTQNRRKITVLRTRSIFKHHNLLRKEAFRLTSNVVQTKL